MITPASNDNTIEFAALTDVFYERWGTDQRGEECRGMLLNLDESEKQLLLPAWSDESLPSREALEEFTGVSSRENTDFLLFAAVKSLFLCPRMFVSVLTQEEIIRGHGDFPMTH